MVRAPSSPVPPSPLSGQANLARHSFTLSPGGAAAPSKDDGERQRLWWEVGDGLLPELLDGGLSKISFGFQKNSQILKFEFEPICDRYLRIS
jgi:hypothetical protein